MYKITLCAAHFKSLPGKSAIVAIDMDGGVYIFSAEMGNKICGEFRWDGNAPIEIALDLKQTPFMDLLLKEAEICFNVQDESKFEIISDISFPALDPEFRDECNAAGHKSVYEHNYSDVKSQLADLLRP